MTVDTEEAGQGDVDVDVMCHTQLVRTRRQKLDAHRHRYTFVPTIVADHSIEVNFNYEVVKGRPLFLCYRFHLYIFIDKTNIQSFHDQTQKYI